VAGMSQDYSEGKSGGSGFGRRSTLLEPKQYRVGVVSPVWVKADRGVR